MKRRKLICWITFGIVVVVVLLMLLRHCHQTIDRPEERQHAVTRVENEADVATGKALHQEKTETFSGHPSPLSQEVNTALEHGAKAKVTLKVVDSTGKKIPGARVHVHFTFFNRGKNDVEGLTDANGLFIAEKESTLSYQWAIQKEGYYETTGKRYLAARSSNASVQDGRWQPWNPTIEVVLKEKRNPIPMYVKKVQAKMPDTEETVGLDLIAGDFVHPHGTGQIADLLLHYRETTGENAYRRYEIVYEMTNGTDGFYVRKKDLFSQFTSPYDADEDGAYIRNLTNVFERTRSDILTDTRNKDDDIFMFRVRTAGHSDSTTKKTLYGKMLLPFRLIDITYYLNPEQGDTNIEFDGKNNLFKPDWRDASWPKDP